MLDGLVLVVSPLISLMQDQVDRARRLGLRAASLTSQDPRPAAHAADGIRESARGTLDLLFCSPERLEAARLRRLLAASPVSLVTIDEAHCISEWGHEFRPAFRRIRRVRPIVRAPVLAVTATATPAVRDDIVQVLGMTDPVRVVTSFDRPNIRWLVDRRPAGAERIRAMVRIIRRAPAECAERALIVYAPTRRLVVSVRRALASHGVIGDAYHAALPKDERQAVQQRFMSQQVQRGRRHLRLRHGDRPRRCLGGLPLRVSRDRSRATTRRPGGRGATAPPRWRSGSSTPATGRCPSRSCSGRVHRRRRSCGSSAKLRSRGGRAHPAAPPPPWSDRDRRTCPTSGGSCVPAPLELHPELAPWVENWPDGEAEGPPRIPRGPLLELTGEDPPDLGPLLSARGQALARLRAMQRYCKGRRCRRMALLRYLGGDARSAVLWLLRSM